MRVLRFCLALLTATSLLFLAACEATVRGGDDAKVGRNWGGGAGERLDEIFGGGSEGEAAGADSRSGPLIHVTSHTSGARIPAPNAVIRGSIRPSGSPLVEVEIYVNGIPRSIALASDGGFAEEVNFRMGRNLVRILAVAKDGRESDAILKLERVASYASVVPTQAARDSKPRLEITYPTNGQVDANRTIRLLGSITAEAGIKRVDVFVNGEPLDPERPLRSDPRRALPLDLPVPLQRGSNLIQVSAYDGEGRVVHEIRNVIHSPDRKRYDRAKPLGPIKRRFAVVIGISDYQQVSEIQPLQFADRDAELVARILREEAGFDEVLLLTNQDATTRKIRGAIHGFLGQAIAEDLVVIYFAGHGAPDPGRLSDLYFITYDTDVNSMATTAFPMFEMEVAVERKIASERVVVIADACHSGGIDSTTVMRGIGIVDNPSHAYIKAMASARGRVAFTAAEASELSREDERWGGGHGVFTYHLAEGLMGAADTNGDRHVTLGELIDYTSEHVRRDTRNEQHPDTSGRFDRDLLLRVIN